MDLSKGYIRLFRQFIDWEWYDDANTMRLFVHCLLLANYTDKKWRGKTIKRGQFITSQPKLAQGLKLSIKQIRGSLTKLKTTGEVAVQTTPEYSIITIKNYDLFQNEGSLLDSQKEKKGQSEGRQRATTNKDNNIENSYINISLSNKKITKEEREILEKYVLKQKRKPDNLQAYIKTLIKNGDWVEIVNKEKQRLEQLQQKKKEQQQTEEERELTEEEERKQEEEIKKIQEEFKKRHHLR